MGELPAIPLYIANYREVLSGQGMLQAFVDTLLIADPSTLIPMLA